LELTNKLVKGGRIEIKVEIDSIPAMAFTAMQDIITDFIFAKELCIYSTRCSPTILYKFWEKLKSIEKVSDDYNYI
jgi:hypothetical protein